MRSVKFLSLQIHATAIKNRNGNYTARALYFSIRHEYIYLTFTVDALSRFRGHDSGDLTEPVVRFNRPQPQRSWKLHVPAVFVYNDGSICSVKYYVKLSARLFIALQILLFAHNKTFAYKKKKNTNTTQSLDTKYAPPLARLILQ